MLAVRDLTAGYGDFQALHRISFTVEAGEIVSIVGSNGAGKSTTLKSVMGIVRPRGGVVELYGKRIDGSPPARVVDRGIALVPEGRNLFPLMTVEDNLLVGANVKRARRDASRRVARMISRFPLLRELRHRQAGNLSGGQQQIVAIARSLMSEPRLLLMDEPSLGLSPKMTRDIFTMVREINAEGVAVVLVEQNAVQALELAHRAYVVAEGRTVMEGNAAEIRGHDDVKRRFLGEL
jgi:branched-chain amino acid transport system ATP-binding protein